MSDKNYSDKNKKYVALFFSVLGICLTLGTIGLIVYDKVCVNPENSKIKIDFNEKANNKISFVTEEQSTETEKTYEGKYGELIADEQRMVEENTYCFDDVSLEEVTLRFAGDVLLDPEYSVMSTLKNHSMDLERSFSTSTLELMRTADVFMVNNEFTFTTRGEPLPNKTFTFRANPEYVSVLNNMGVDIVSIGNNHISDYGEISLLDTLDTLNSAKIPYVGAGKNLHDASRPAFIVSNYLKIGYLCATQVERMPNPDTKGATETTPGTMRCMDPTILAEKIKETKENCDFLIVYVHWGKENEVELDYRQPEQAKIYAEAGADLIIGDHPHILQGIDYVDDTPVFYSMGNFWFNSKAVDTAIAEVKVNSEGIQTTRIIPCLQQNCCVKEPDLKEKQRILNDLQNMSSNVQIDEDGYITKRTGEQ